MKSYQEITVDEKEYLIYPLDVTVSYRILLQILKMSGHSITSVVDIKDGESDADVAQFIVSLISKVLTNLDVDYVLSLNPILFHKSRCIPKGNPYLNYEAYFNEQGLGHMVSLKAEIMRVNFADFLLLVRKRFESAKLFIRQQNTTKKPINPPTKPS